MREVRFNAYEASGFDAIKEQVGYAEFTQAVGYLSTWAIAGDAYPKVTLYANPKELEITATYWKADGKLGYVIGAVWHEGHFGFHS